MSDLSPLCAQKRTCAGSPNRGLICPPASPHNDTMATTQARTPKTKVEPREMLAEAVRNTQVENQRLQQAKRVKAA